MLVHHKVTPALHSPVPTHLYMCTLVERGIVRVKCLAQEHSAMTWPGLEPGLLDPEAKAVTMRPIHLHKAR